MGVERGQRIELEVVPPGALFVVLVEVPVDDVALDHSALGERDLLAADVAEDGSH